MILSQKPENPFQISKIEVDGLDLSKHFASLVIEESILRSFPYGTLTLSREFLDYMSDWDEVEIGFVGKIVSISWTTDLDNGKNKRNADFLVYGCNKDTKDTISLLLCSKEAPEFYTKQFCDYWEDTETSNIISDILKKHSGIKKSNVTPATSKVTYSNPLQWTPAAACKYIVPMMDGSDGCAYFLFSSIGESGIETKCMPFNKMTKDDSDEKITLLSKIPDDKREVKTNLSTALYFDFNPASNNILQQLSDNEFGLSVIEYDVKTATQKNSNINMLEKNVSKIGSKSGLTELYDSSFRSSFRFSGLNAQTSEKSKSVHYFVSNSNIRLTLPGVSSRKIGVTIDVDLYSEKNLITDPRSERSGKSVVTIIKHHFTPLSYFQIVSCVKTGLNKWRKRESI